MEILSVGNMKMIPSPNAKSRYDIFEVRSGEGIKKAYQKDVAYGVSFARAIELMVERESFDKAQDMKDFLIQYKNLREELLEKVRKLLEEQKH